MRDILGFYFVLMQSCKSIVEISYSTGCDKLIHACTVQAKYSMYCILNRKDACEIRLLHMQLYLFITILNSSTGTCQNMIKHFYQHDDTTMHDSQRLENNKTLVFITMAN